MAPTKVVVVQDGVGATGQSVLCEHREEVVYADLVAALSAAGLAILKPKPTSPEVALGRAIGCCKPVGAVKVSVGKGRWTIHRRIKMVGDHVTHQQTMVVKLVAGQVSVRYDLGAQDVGWEQTVRESWQHHQLHLTSGDVRSWFDNVASRALDAIHVGGRWYVPAPKKIVLRGVAGVLASIGIELSIWDVGMGGTLLQDALAALEAEAAPLIKEANDLLDEDSRKEPSERNLTARRASVETLAKVREKMARYYAMFKVPMGASQTKLMDLELRLAGTAFRMRAADRGQDVSGAAPILDLDDAPAGGVAALVEDDGPVVRILDLDDGPRSGGDDDLDEKVMPELEID